MDNAISPDPTPLAKPWYRSTTLQGLAVMLIMLALQQAKVNVPGLDGDVATAVDLAFQVIGAVMVAVGRVQATKQITGTAKTAAAINGGH